MTVYTKHYLRLLTPAGLHAGPLPANWPAGLFRLSDSNQDLLEQAAETFLLGSDDGDSYPYGLNAGTSNTLAQYSFAYLGLTGSIPPSWSDQCKSLRLLEHDASLHVFQLKR